MKKVIVVTIIVALLVVAGVWLSSGDRGPQPLEPRSGVDAGSASEPVELDLTTRTVELDGESATFRLPEGFAMTVAEEGLGKARFVAESPDGRLFVPDLVDYNLSPSGAVYILEDFNTETGEFETRHTYLDGLRGANSVAFYTDESGQDWLYLALTDHLLRYPYEPGDTEPSGEPEVVIEFPDTQNENATSVVWHITRTIEFHDGRLYVAIGSGCNTCEQEGDDSLRAKLVSMTPTGEDVQTYARGLRNAVGFTWADGELFATENGVDHLGADRPDDLLYRLEAGEHYGWPYCYELAGEVLPDTSRNWDNPISCEAVSEAFAAFPPRSAPLGVTYFTEGPAELEESFLVSLHGSFDSAMRSGYEVRRVTPDGEQDVFMDGFQREDSDERVARPVDFHQHDEDSFFLTDDHGGRIFYIYAQ